MQNKHAPLVHKVKFYTDQICILLFTALRSGISKQIKFNDLFLVERVNKHTVRTLSSEILVLENNKLLLIRLDLLKTPAVRQIYQEDIIPQGNALCFAFVKRHPCYLTTTKKFEK